jgi:hypothetical protein
LDVCDDNVRAVGRKASSNGYADSPRTAYQLSILTKPTRCNSVSIDNTARRIRAPKPGSPATEFS